MALKASDKETARAYLLCMGSVLEAVASGNEDGAIQTLREMVGGDDETFEQTLSAHETLAQVVTAGADDEEDFDDEDEDDFDDEEETADADEDEEDESDDDEEDFDDEDESEDDESEDESDEDDEDEDEEDEDEEDEDEGGEADLTSTASLISLSSKQRKTRAALISVASQGLTYEDPTHVTASDEDEDEDEDFDSDEGDDSEDGLDDIDIPDETVTARVKRAKQKRKGKATASIHKRTKSKNPGGFL